MLPIINQVAVEAILVMKFLFMMWLNRALGHTFIHLIFTNKNSPLQNGIKMHLRGHEGTEAST